VALQGHRGLPTRVPDPAGEIGGEGLPNLAAERVVETLRDEGELAQQCPALVQFNATAIMPPSWATYEFVGRGDLRRATAQPLRDPERVLVVRIGFLHADRRIVGAERCIRTVGESVDGRAPMMPTQVTTALSSADSCARQAAV
jgi:hypothetical protein